MQRESLYGIKLSGLEEANHTSADKGQPDAGREPEDAILCGPAV